ncbi:MAG: AAA family ATPase [Coriobacteriales bacterium]|nr:AAA family ATPase [Coriobacteriales bacterium]
MSKRVRVDGIPTIAVEPTPEALLVRGAVGCGKTQMLVERVQELCAQGCTLSSITVLCATPDAAGAFSERLQTAGIETCKSRGFGKQDGALGQEAAAGVCVCSAYELALELLSVADNAGLGSLDSPRVLLPYEEDVLFEDLKVSGQEPERLWGMLSFFKRSMTEISDDHPDFLMDDDEADVYHRLTGWLSRYGARITEQVSADASRFLAGKGSAVRCDHVLVDDYQLLSRASQVMANLLASKSICIATNPDALERVFEAYPYARGVAEFLEANPEARQYELNEFKNGSKPWHAVNALRQEAGENDILPMSDKPGDQSIPDWPCVTVLENPQAEISHVAGIVSDALKQGESPESIYIVSPAPQWNTDILHALAERGIACKAACEPSIYAMGDVRDNGYNTHLRVLAALLLAGNKNDDVAWRSWCAFGDYLASSNVFEKLGYIADAEGLSLHKVLEACLYSHIKLPEGTPLYDLARVLDAYQAGCEVIEAARGLRGEALAHALTSAVCGEEAPVPPQFAALCEGAPQDADAEVLRAYVLKRAAFPGWTGGECPNGAVRIGSMERLCGLSPNCLVFAGFVNGFFPSRGFFDPVVTPPGKVGAVHATDARRLCAAVGKAKNNLEFTAFSALPQADAERLNLKIDRIALVKRVRTAMVSASVFCGVMCGQQNCDR